MAIKDHRLFVLMVYNANVPSGLIFKDDEGGDPKFSFTRGDYTTYVFSRPVALITDESLTYTRALFTTYGNSRFSVPFVDGNLLAPLTSTAYLYEVS